MSPKSLKEHNFSHRRDFEIITSWVNPGSRVLDLGCGDGSLLEMIRETRKVNSENLQGIEKDWETTLTALSRGLSVLNGGIAHNLNLIPGNSFDMIILSKTIQELVNPHEIISTMLTKGKTAVISFLNYGYWFNRLFFLLRGKKPISKGILFNWYNSPDLHPLSIKDFEDYCQKHKITILKKVYLKGDWVRVNNFLPNFFAGYAIYHIEKKNENKKSISKR